MSHFKNTAEENYYYIKNLPIVSKLLAENKRIKRKNKDLKKLIKLITRNAHMFASNNNKQDCECNQTNNYKPQYTCASTPDVYRKPNISYEIKEVVIKNEPIVSISTDNDSDIEIIIPIDIIDIINIDDKKLEEEEEEEEVEEEEVEEEEEEEEEVEEEEVEEEEE